MFKKTFVFLAIAVILAAVGGTSFAMCGMCGTGEQKGGEVAATGETSSKVAVDVGNKVCPVSDEAIKEETKATFEYDGKVYNFCCPMCIDEFKKDPAKYIAKIEEQKTAVESAATAESSDEEHAGHEH